MAKLLEDGAKSIARARGISVPRGRSATSAADAGAVAAELGGGVVVKALVPTGRRGKAGAVRFASGREEAGEHANALLGMEVNGFTAQSVLVEERLAIAEELYLAITFSAADACAAMVLGRVGGVDVETAWRERPDAFRRLLVDPLAGFTEATAAEAWRSLGVAPSTVDQLTVVTWACWEMFCATEAEMLEVNPLALTADGAAVAAAIMLDVDDEALFRHPELDEFVEYGQDRFLRPFTAREQAVLAADRAEPGKGSITFMETDGDIGFLITGGGGSMVAFDLLERLGGRPANYVDISPGFTKKKLLALTRSVLSIPGIRGLVVGGARKVNMPVDQFVEAIAECCHELDIDTRRFPIVARLVGLNQDRARELAERLPGLAFYGDDVFLDDALERIVERISLAGT